MVGSTKSSRGANESNLPSTFLSTSINVVVSLRRFKGGAAPTAGTVVVVVVGVFTRGSTRGGAEVVTGAGSTIPN